MDVWEVRANTGLEESEVELSDATVLVTVDEVMVVAVASEKVV